MKCDLSFMMGDCEGELIEREDIKGKALLVCKKCVDMVLTYPKGSAAISISLVNKGYSYLEVYKILKERFPKDYGASCLPQTEEVKENNLINTTLQTEQQKQ